MRPGTSLLTQPSLLCSAFPDAGSLREAGRFQAMSVLVFCQHREGWRPHWSGEPRGPCSSLHRLGKPGPHRFAEEQGNNTSYLDGGSPSRWPWIRLQPERQRLAHGSPAAALPGSATPCPARGSASARAARAESHTVDPQRSSKKSQVHSPEELLHQIMEN